MDNPYAVLGVDRQADEDAIRKAYRSLARKYHPDVNTSPDAETQFKRVNAAYEVLGDPEKRRLYDEFGDASLRPGFDPNTARAWSRGGTRSTFDFDFGAGNVDDLLGSLFGGGGFRSRSTRGRDQKLEITVDFVTALRGGERRVQVRRPDGRVDTLKVPIPAGAKDGGRVRLKGQGLPPPGGGPCGDLLVHLHVPEHPVLRRVGDDLEMDVPITVLEALGGGSITVPTISGDVKLTVPAGARSGTRLRIRGRGVQRRDRKGDLYLVLRPTVPEAAGEEALEALEAARTLDRFYGDVRADLKL